MEFLFKTGSFMLELFHDGLNKIVWHGTILPLITLGISHMRARWILPRDDSHFGTRCGSGSGIWGMRPDT